MTEKDNVTRPRPYSLPAEIDFNALPPAAKAALDSVIQPTYEEQVMAKTAECLQPAHGSFDNPAATKATQRPAILSGCPRGHGDDG